ncbi:serine/threonine protein kinase [Streptomyces sp. NBC_00237]|uniref:serine/threonine-protein kinase n=1 Tax=Streptomyces sp. NBC_00237 TaxID=2975687 RepID=UPI00225051AC|nr:serine/threonine-protein kinase [Streptomyces sp. NBC_00237]MCX5207080.1 serine/threonine protein kinase [Streptomyces sp. NBC_00237]
MATGENERLAGRYRVIEQLGRGGMGVVWRAVDEVLGREVAVKELRTYNDSSAPELADLTVRMQREARAAARVRHSGVVAVHDVTEHDGRPVIVMELVDGPSLDDVLSERGPLDPREAAGIGAKVLESLAAAHRVGVLHRDVKPGNILLEHGGRVVLTDFGIAAMEDPGDGSTTHLTRSGELVGSLDYLAPERAQGQEPGPASDVWALGATLYAAVEGGSPFRRTSTWSTLTAIVVEPLPEPVRSGPLGPVLQRLMSKDPAHRPGAEEAALLLAAVADGTAPGAGTDAVHPSAGQAQLPSQQQGFGPAAAYGQQQAQGFGPHTPPASPAYGAEGPAYPGGPTPAGQSPYPTGPTPAAYSPYGTGPAASTGQAFTGQQAYGSGSVPSGGGPAAQPSSAAAAPVSASQQGGSHGAGGPRGSGAASGGRRKAVVAAGVAAVLLVGAGVTYAVSGRDGDTRASGSPTATGSAGDGDAPREDSPLAPGSLPTDADLKTKAPTPPDKDGSDKDGKGKGKDADKGKPTPTKGGKESGAGGDGTSTGGKNSGGTTGASTGGKPDGGSSGSGSGSTGGGSNGTTGGNNPPAPPPPPAPACRGAGGGKYNCDVWRTSDSIRTNGDRAGTLNAGTNYFYCQADLGRRVTYGKWTNVWWAKTDDDSGNTNVYVSVVYLKGGDNDRPLPGLPTC